MSLWSSIRRMWTRHDERLAENELERESVGVELPTLVDESAFLQEGAKAVPNEAMQAVEAEAEAEKDDQAAE